MKRGPDMTKLLVASLVLAAVAVLVVALLGPSPR